MILPAAEPIIFHSGSLDGVCLHDYPTTYRHLINSFFSDLEASTLFIYYSEETTNNFCQFCFEKLPIVKQNKYEFCTSWHSICKIQCVNMNCYNGLKGCTEKFIKNKM